MEKSFFFRLIVLLAACWLSLSFAAAQQPDPPMQVVGSYGFRSIDFMAKLNADNIPLDSAGFDVDGIFWKGSIIDDTVRASFGCFDPNVTYTITTRYYATNGNVMSSSFSPTFWVNDLVSPGQVPVVELDYPGLSGSVVLCESDTSPRAVATVLLNTAFYDTLVVKKVLFKVSAGMSSDPSSYGLVMPGGDAADSVIVVGDTVTFMVTDSFVNWSPYPRVYVLEYLLNGEVAGFAGSVSGISIIADARSYLHSPIPDTLVFSGCDGNSQPFQVAVCAATAISAVVTNTPLSVIEGDTASISWDAHIVDFIGLTINGGPQLAAGSMNYQAPACSGIDTITFLISRATKPDTLIIKTIHVLPRYLRDSTHVSNNCVTFAIISNQVLGGEAVGVYFASAPDSLLFATPNLVFTQVQGYRAHVVVHGLAANTAYIFRVITPAMIVCNGTANAWAITTNPCELLQPSVTIISSTSGVTKIRLVNKHFAAQAGSDVIWSAKVWLKNSGGQWNLLYSKSHEDYFGGWVNDDSTVLGVLALTLLPGQELRVQLTLHPQTLAGCNANNQVAVYETQLTSVDTPQAETEVSVYPNPTADQFSFDWKNGPATWELISPTGQVVRYGDATPGKNTVSVSDVPVGIYIFRLGGKTAKVVVTH